MSSNTNIDYESSKKDIMEGKWYTLWDPKDAHSNGISDVVKSTIQMEIQRIRIEYENKLIDLRHEIIGLKHDVLRCKELIAKLNEELSRYKPALDLRKRNQLIRSQTPFPFIPDASTGSNNS